MDTEKELIDNFLMKEKEYQLAKDELKKAFFDEINTKINSAKTKEDFSIIENLIRDIPESTLKINLFYLNDQQKNIIL